MIGKKSLHNHLYQDQLFRFLLLFFSPKIISAQDREHECIKLMGVYIWDLRPSQTP